MNNLPDTIFLDADDTLFDWTGEVRFRITGSRVWTGNPWSQFGLDIHQSAISRVMESEDFWHSLVVTEQGERILQLIQELPQDVIILTALPPLANASASARRAAAISKVMITERLGLPVYLLADAPGTKWHEMKARLAGPRKLLVDDSQRNVEAFTRAGGQGVLVPRPWNAGVGDPVEMLRFLCEPIEGVDLPLPRRFENTAMYGGCV